MEKRTHSARSFTWQNIHNVPIILDALSIRFFYHQTPRSMWQTITTLFRMALSYFWGQSFLPDALKRDSGAPYKVAKCISAAVFDNFSICAVGGLMVDEEPGEQMNMTNWVSLAIPEAAVGSSDLAQQLERQLLNGGSLLREDLRHDDFINVFSPSTPILLDSVQHVLHVACSIASAAHLTKNLYPQPVCHALT
eukprot:6207845-Pleurochrysis_carterae.AAC.2